MQKITVINADLLNYGENIVHIVCVCNVSTTNGTKQNKFRFLRGGSFQRQSVVRSEEPRSQESKPLRGEGRGPLPLGARRILNASGCAVRTEIMQKHFTADSTELFHFLPLVFWSLWPQPDGQELYRTSRSTSNHHVAKSSRLANHTFRKRS